MRVRVRWLGAFVLGACSGTAIEEGVLVTFRLDAKIEPSQVNPFRVEVLTDKGFPALSENPVVIDGVTLEGDDVDGNGARDAVLTWDPPDAAQFGVRLGFSRAITSVRPDVRPDVRIEAYAYRGEELLGRGTEVFDVPADGRGEVIVEIGCVAAGCEAQPDARLDATNSDASVIPDGASGTCEPGTWTPVSAAFAPSGRRGHTAVWTGDGMIVWGGQTELGPLGSNDGALYDPISDTWSPTSLTGAPSVRSWHSAVWTGSEMIVWGAWLAFMDGTGGRYDPAKDSWMPTSTTGAPSGRYYHTAVWTGSEMIVWGGSVSALSNTGGRYDPEDDSWTPTTTSGAPLPRWGHTSVWTGSEMIVWGGSNSISYTNTGGSYFPISDTWLATPIVSAPLGRVFHSAVWSGSEMLIWGGSQASPLDSGGRLGSSAWALMSTVGAPSARENHSVVWAASSDRMIVWGGEDTAGSLGDGAIYSPGSPGTDSWADMTSAGAPPARSAPRAVWTGSEMIVWGGLTGGGGYTNTGARYCP